MYVSSSRAVQKRKDKFQMLLNLDSIKALLLSTDIVLYPGFIFPPIICCDNFLSQNMSGHLYMLFKKAIYIFHKYILSTTFINLC